MKWKRWSLEALGFLGLEQAPSLTGGTLELAHQLEGGPLLAARWSFVVRLASQPTAPLIHELIGGVRSPLGAPWLVGQLDAGWVLTELGSGPRLRVQLGVQL